MRILIVSHDRELLGGIAQHTGALARRLAARGHQVWHLAAVGSGRVPRGVLRWGLEESVAIDAVADVLLVPPQLDGGSGCNGELGLHHGRVQRLFSSFLDRARPDVVHVNNLHGLPSSLIETAARAGYPVVNYLREHFFLCPNSMLLRPDLSACEGPKDIAACAHCVPPPPGRAAKLKEWVRLVLGARLARRLKAILRFGAGPRRGNLAAPVDGAAPAYPADGRASRYLAQRLSYHIWLLNECVVLNLSVSDYLRERHIQFGVAPERIRISRVGTEAVECLRPIWRPPESGELVVAYLGTVTQVKGCALLAEAYGKARRPGWELVYHGFVVDGCREVIERRAGESVVFTGRYVPSELGERLREAHVAVIPSLCQETAGQTVFEAFACGVPVIAARIGGIPESVHDGVNGLLFKAGDPEDLAQKLRQVADEPGLLSRLAAGVRPTRTLAEHIGELEGIYLEVVARGARRPGPSPLARG